MLEAQIFVRLVNMYIRHWKRLMIRFTVFAVRFESQYVNTDRDLNVSEIEYSEWDIFRF
jgi:hypothetical protein